MPQGARKNKYAHDRSVGLASVGFDVTIHELPFHHSATFHHHIKCADSYRAWRSLCALSASLAISLVLDTNSSAMSSDRVYRAKMVAAAWEGNETRIIVRYITKKATKWALVNYA